MEILMKSMFEIVLDNSIARAHNINIDYPSYTCFALNKEEAIGKMLLSDFSYKHRTIDRINIF